MFNKCCLLIINSGSSQLRDYVEYLGDAARVVLVPSIRDANHDFVFPQVYLSMVICLYIRSLADFMAVYHPLKYHPLITFLLLCSLVLISAQLTSIIRYKLFMILRPDFAYLNCFSH